MMHFSTWSFGWKKKKVRRLPIRYLRQQMVYEVAMALHGHLVLLSIVFIGSVVVKPS